MQGGSGDVHHWAAVALAVKVSKGKLREQIGAFSEPDLKPIRAKSDVLNGLRRQSVQQTTGVGTKAIDFGWLRQILITLVTLDVIKAAGVTG